MEAELNYIENDLVPKALGGAKWVRSCLVTHSPYADELSEMLPQLFVIHQVTSISCRLRDH
jgi:hypothetical protein